MVAHFPLPFMRAPITSLLLASTLLVAGCGSATGTQAPKQNAAWTVPSDWPADLPVYPGATIGTSANINPDSTKPGMMLSMDTTDTPQQVSQFYAKTLRERGWTVDGTTDGGKYTAVMCTNADRMATVHATTKSEGGTSILIATGEK